MTIRGEKISIVQLLLSVIGGLMTIVLAFMAYFMRDMSESVRSVKEDVAGIKVGMQATRDAQANLKEDTDDIRAILYDHISRDKN